MPRAPDVVVISQHIRALGRQSWYTPKKNKTVSGFQIMVMVHNAMKFEVFVSPGTTENHSAETLHSFSNSANEEIVVKKILPCYATRRRSCTQADARSPLTRCPRPPA